MVLRRFREQDAPALAAYRSDPEVARYQGYDGCTLAEAEEFVASMHGLSPGVPGRWFQFAVSLRRADGLIGDCALRCRNHEPRQAELGFSFARAHQGVGLATDAVRTLLDYAFSTLDLHRVLAITDVRNTRARRLLERLGLRQEARFEKNTFFRNGREGEWSSESLYATLQEEWQQGSSE